MVRFFNKIKISLYFILILFVFSNLFYGCQTTQYAKKEDLIKEKRSIDIFFKEYFEEDEKQDLLFQYAVQLYNDGIDDNDYDKLRKALDIFEYLYSVKKYKSAKSYIVEIKKLFSSRIKYYNKMIKYYKKKKNRYMMAVYYKKILMLDPKNKEANKFLNDNRGYLKERINYFIKKGNQLIKQKKYDLAKQYFSWVLWLEPDNSEAKKGIEKINSLTKALATKYFKKAVGYYKSSDFTNAKKYFNLAIKYGYPYSEIKPYFQNMKNIQYLESLYQLYKKYISDEKNYLKAIKIEKKINAINSNYKNFKSLQKQFKAKLKEYLKKLYNQAVNLYYKKNYKKALQIFQLIAQFDPDYQDIQEYINRCKAKLEALGES